MPARRINEIVHGERSITSDAVLRLPRYFGLSERFWINLQAHYDLEVEKDRLRDRLERKVKVLAALLLAMGNIPACGGTDIIDQVADTRLRMLQCLHDRAE